MVKAVHKSHIVVAFFLCFVASVFGQELPKMPVDPAIQSGVLPNGTNYYVIANSDTKGMADFALVHKAGRTFGEKVPTLDISERLMTCIPVLDSLSPRRFFMENDIIPKDGRFLWNKDGAAVYRFSNVPVERIETVDSTLLVLMGMVHTARNQEDEFSRICYAPSESAIIVSGDINADEIVGKIRMLSYITPFSKAVERGEYKWNESDAQFFVVPSAGKTAEIKVSWRMPATPEAFKGTIQPAVHGKLMGELGYIASERIRKAFAVKGIACADVKYMHAPSSETGSDEEFHISVIVDDKAVVSASATLAEVFSSLAGKGTSFAERRAAHHRFMHQMFDKTRRPVKTDAEYVEVCINAFLHGAVPVSQSHLYEFYVSKDVSDSASVVALNRMAAAVMTLDRNVSILCRTASGMPVDSLKTAFTSAWNGVSAVDAAGEIHVSDTLLNLAPEKNIPLTFFRKEHLSGGHLWTFGNGIRVVYKRMDTGGKIFWAMGLNGGYGNIRDLAVGEGAFVNDMFRLCKVAGMPWDDFVLFLEDNGVYVDVRVGVASTVISGVASSTGGVPKVMRALKAMADERTSDNAAFDAYRRNEWLRLENAAGNSNVIVDSLMCPGYRYSKVKSRGKLSKNLLSKSDELFEDIFSKVNDGVIVIIGDQNEAIVRKQLRGYLGRFRTRTSMPVRPMLSYQLTAGSMTHAVQGERNAVYLAMSVPMPLTVENYAVSEVAGMVLKSRISSSLVGTGMHAKVYWDTRIAPQERFNVLVVLEDVEGVHKADAEETARKAVRDQLKSAGISGISDAQVDACKEWLKHNHSLSMQSPQYWVNAVLLRYLEGKDFTSAYDAEMESVTSDKVKNLLSRLAEASQVEYIIRKK